MSNDAKVERRHDYLTNAALAPRSMHQPGRPEERRCI